MKKVLFLMLSALPLIVDAQTGNFDVKGKVGKLGQPAKAFLLRKINGQDAVDSVTLTAGGFEFKGNIQDPEQALLLLDHSGVGWFKLISGVGGLPDMLNLYLENAAVQIAGTDSLSKAKITGSKLNDENVILATAIKPVMVKAQGLSNAYQKAAEADRPKFAEKFKELQNEQKAVLAKFIKQNPQSFASLDAVRSFAGPSPNYYEVMPLFNSLSASIQNTGNGRNYKAALEKLKVTSIGSVAPDFTQNDPSGKPISLSSFKGKYVLVDFWASWCGPCRQENPNVVKVYNQYKNKNFTVLGVSLDQPNGKDAWLKAIKDDGLTWNHVSDLQFWNNEAAALYGVRAIPENFLIDPKGKIIAKDLRGAELEQTLAQVLK